MRAVILMFCASGLFAAGARAERGEVVIEANIAPEVAWLAHPEVHTALASPFEATGSFTVLPRFGFGGRYGLFNAVALGLGVDAAAIPGVRAAGVSFENTRGDLLTGTYGELCAPLSVAWRLDSGFDVSATLSVGAGPMLAVWAGNALGDPKRPDADGLPSRLPVEIGDAWRVGGVLRASAALELRFFDVFLVSVTPFAALSWAGTPGFHVGLALSPAIALHPV